MLRWILVGVAYATVIGTAVVLLITGSVNTVLNLALLALVAPRRGAGAVNCSPHTWRAGLRVSRDGLVALGSAWLLSNAFIGARRLIGRRSGGGSTADARIGGHGGVAQW